MAVSPDDMCCGFGHLRSLGKEERFYDFICTYVRRMVPDNKWKKKMKQHPEEPVFSFITPSDIAYVIALITNGRDVWDQAKRLMSTPDAPPEKKEKTLFSTGEGKKRESGKLVWNNEGLEYYYSVEKKWRVTYNSEEEFSVMINGWEKWEPKEKSKKDPLRTVWKHEEKKTNKDGSEGGNRWWETEGEGYDTDLDLAASFVWDKDVLKKVDGNGDDESEERRSSIGANEDDDNDNDHEQGEKTKKAVRSSARTKTK